MSNKAFNFSVAMSGVLVFLIVFAGLTAWDFLTSNPSAKEEVKPYIDLVPVTEWNNFNESDGGAVYYDSHTGVMYYSWYHNKAGYVTPILNADGTPKIYEYWEQ